MAHLNVLAYTKGYDRASMLGKNGAVRSITPGNEVGLEGFLSTSKTETFFLKLSSLHYLLVQ